MNNSERAWKIADRYRQKLITDGGTQDFNTIVNDIQEELDLSEERCTSYEWSSGLYYEALVSARDELEKHLRCGDAYPNEGWPDVRKVLAKIYRAMAKVIDPDGGKS